MLELALRLRGFPHRTYVCHGNVTGVLPEIIRQNKIDMLVAGTHGGGFLYGLNLHANELLSQFGKGHHLPRRQDGRRYQEHALAALVHDRILACSLFIRHA